MFGYFQRFRYFVGSRIFACEAHLLLIMFMCIKSILCLRFMLTLECFKCLTKISSSAKI